MSAVLELHDLRLRRESIEILRGVSFAVEPGELVAVMGPSGSGKTTILRAIAGLETFHGGHVRAGEVSLAAGATPASSPPVKATLRELRRSVGLVFQFHYLFEHLSALDNVCLAPVHTRGVSRPDAERRAFELLNTLGVEHRASALPRELSGGEAQRVAIARALAVDPRILLMDEPTAALDARRREELGALLRALVQKSRTMLVVTHDEEFARTFATRVLQLADGRITAT
jgi:ABC-type polar amino acid transport system ATPase subunit